MLSAKAQRGFFPLYLTPSLTVSEKIMWLLKYIYSQSSPLYIKNKEEKGHAFNTK